MIGYRPVDRAVAGPLLRWTILRSAVWAVRSRQGVIFIRHGTTFTVPYASSSSIIDNLLTRDRHRRAAVEAIDAWRSQRVGGLRERPVRWSVVPALVDVVILVGGWQVACSPVLLP